MISSLLTLQDVGELEDMMLLNGKIVPVPYSCLESISQEKISLFCHKYGIYQIPTTELIDFLKSEVKGLKTIEIGAGNGCIGRAVNIRMTDNMMQLWPKIQMRYKNMAQPIINYGDDVEEIDANEAVLKYQPECVLGCWITEKWYPGMKHGNEWGPLEPKMFADGIQKYIMIGNEGIHKGKRLERLIKPQKLKFPWLVSRSMRKDENLIYIFKR